MENPVPDTPPEIIIRATMPSDLDAFRELRLEGLREHPTAFGAHHDTERGHPAAWWSARMLPQDSPTGGIIQVAVAGDDLVGMAGLNPGSSLKMRHGAMLWGVYLRPAWRGRGIAERMIEGCIAWGREHGVRKVTLGVATTNTPAIRCYASLSFTVYGVEPEVIAHDGVYYDELLMLRMI